MLKPFFELDDGPVGSALGTPPAEPTGPAPDEGGQPTEVQSEFAQHMGLDLTSIPEEQRPAMIERLKQVDSAFTPAMQQFKPWRTLADEGFTPDQVRRAVDFQRAIDQDKAGVIRLLQASMEGQQPQGQGQPADPMDAYIADLEAKYDAEDVRPFKGIAEYAKQARQTVEQLKQERQQEKRVEMLKSAQRSVEDFVKANPELGLTGEQLLGVCHSNKHNPFTQLQQAAIDAMGGMDKFLTAKNKQFLADYQKRALENRGKSGPVVAGGGAVGTQLTPTGNWDDHFEQIQERFRTNRAAREGG
ncbi:MAG: hypothetical protein ABIH23_10515 [bacterium]